MVACCAVVLAMAGAASGQAGRSPTTDGISRIEAPAVLPELEKVGIADRRGAQPRADIELRDSRGNTVKWGSLFDGRRPVLLVLNYYRCPLLCPKLMNEVQQAINDVELNAGSDYRLVVVSFDHTDTHLDSRPREEVFKIGYSQEAGPDGIAFFTGSAANVRELAVSVGFIYRYLPESNQFSHPSGIFFLTPDGEVHNFMENATFEPRDVKLALVEASSGTVGTIFDRVFLACFQFDSASGTYLIHPRSVMRLGGAATVLALGGGIGIMLWRQRHSARLRGYPASGPPAAAAT